MLDGACVFLRDDRLCALHVAGEKELGTPFKLKPAICLLWPLCVVDGELDVGYASFTRRKECCAPVRDGARTIYDVIGPDDASIRHDGAAREHPRRRTGSEALVAEHLGARLTVRRRAMMATASASASRAALRSGHGRRHAAMGPMLV